MSAPPRSLSGVPVRPAVAGTAGSTLVAVGALGSGARPAGGWPVLPEALGTALAVAGVVLLLAAWWRTRRHLATSSPRGLVGLAAAWSLPLLVAPPVLSRDVYAYAGQALVLARGGDPYADGPASVPGRIAGEVDPVWAEVPSPYGPAFLGPAGLLLRATGDEPVMAVLALRLLAVLGLVLTAWALPVVARACGVPEPRALWLGLLNPLGLLHGAGGAHNDALMVGLLVAGVALALSSRWAAAGVAVGLAGSVKAPALAALPFLVLAVPGLRAQLRAAVPLVGSAVLAGVAAHALAGTGAGWLGALDSGRARASLLSPTTGLGTLAGETADALGLTDDVDAVREAVLAVGLVLATALVLALLVRTARHAGPREAVLGLGQALLVVVLLSPTVLPWYALWAVVPLAGAVGARAASALGAACAVLCLAVWPSGRFVVRPPLYGLHTVVAAVAAGVAHRTSNS